MHKSLLLVLLAVSSAAAAADAGLRQQATLALERGAKFFRTRVAVEGTYLWQYSADLSRREGEGKATPTQGWTHPPGTPAVGLALLDAWHATSNRYFLDAARETANGLIRGQVRSGGWHYTIEFDPAARRKVAYRMEGGTSKARNVTTFDDDTTQAALRFLIRFDEATGFSDTAVRECIQYALEALFKAQYPNGAWPQGYDEFPDPAKFPVKKASYPETWPREWPGSGKYWLRYTLNDNSMATLIDTLFAAAKTYSVASAGTNFQRLAQQCRSAAQRSGDFLILAQMPEPQPAWAQQYDFDMQPAWARKFEPPSVTGGESKSALKTLMKMYDETGDKRYLEPIPRALAYLRRSRLPDGRLARFYELQSNKPLYFTKDYRLTFDDSDMPTHYAFKVGDDTDSITAQYERVKSSPPKRRARNSFALTPGVVDRVRTIIAAQDSEGRWVEQGKLRYHGPDDSTTNVIRCSTFIANMETLSRYLEASAGK